MPKQLESIDQVKSWVTKANQQLRMTCPRGMDPDRLIQMAFNAVRTNRDLAQCDAFSLFGSIAACIRYGLEPGVLAHIVPFKDKGGGKRAQMIPDYRGLFALVRRSGEIGPIHADVVYDNDRFIYQRGSEPKLTHEPNLIERGRDSKIIAVYCVAHSKDMRWFHAEAMSLEEVHSIKNSSPGGHSSYSPWNTHFNEMAKKTVARRVCKYLPVGYEIHNLIQMDEKAETGDISSFVEITKEMTGEGPEDEGKSRTERLESELGGEK